MSNEIALKNLKDLLTGSQLPALPQSAIRLLELSQNPENGPEQFAKPLEADPGLASQVLKFVNSSYFGFSREISSVKMAISLVGPRTINNFALWSAVFSLIPNPKCGPFDLKLLWVDSLRRGLFARAYAKQLGLSDAEDLFTIALLQDLAIPMLTKTLPEPYTRLFSNCSTHLGKLAALEQVEFGWTHADAAGVIGRLWNLPEKFALFLETHAQLTELLGQKKRDLSQICVALSALLPATNDDAWHEQPTFAQLYTELAGPKRKLSLEEMIAHIDLSYAEVAPLLQLPTPPRSLVHFLEATVVVQK